MPGIDRTQIQILFYLISSETALNVLLIAENQQSSTHQSFLFEQAMELRFCVLQAHLVGTVHHPDHPVSLLEVVTPV